MKVGMYMVPARVAFLDLGFRLKGEGGMLPAATRRAGALPAACRRMRTDACTRAQLQLCALQFCVHGLEHVLHHDTVTWADPCRTVQPGSNFCW